jgi:hypothetical protein
MNERDTKFGNKHNECCSTQTETHTTKIQKLEEEIECSKHLHAQKKKPPQPNNSLKTENQRKEGTGKKNPRTVVKTENPKTPQQQQQEAQNSGPLCLQQ